jgi:hypothetical protein
VLVPADKLLGGDGNEAAPLYYICETSKETGTTARRIRTGLCRMFLYPCCVICVLCVCVCCVFCPQRQEGEKSQGREVHVFLSCLVHFPNMCLCCVLCCVSYESSFTSLSSDAGKGGRSNQLTLLNNFCRG